MVINPIVQVCLFGPIFYGAFAPINEDSFSRPNVVSLISFISSWVLRWAAGLFKTTFLHIYTRDRHGDDVPERLELRTVEQVRIEPSETSERVEWFRVKVFFGRIDGLGNGFPNIFAQQFVKNSGVPCGGSLHHIWFWKCTVRFWNGDTTGVDWEGKPTSKHDINWRMYSFDIFLKTILNSDQWL